MTALSPKPKIPKKCQSVLAPHGIGYRMRLLSQLTSRRFQEQLDALEMGLTPFHWVVLCCLWQEDGLATTKIVEKLQQVGGTLTGVLDRMEERKLIYRERDISDRRIWRIWLTATGKQLQEVLPPIVFQLIEETTLGITQDERELFSRLVDKMIANLS
ncbi:MarR family transcriptional regulator [Tumidithrix elongata RA019]|uniref:MarR family transcriptional regulator n=1 Tax=Tumidithrix elongata BACA0141 TaxID=2716417 RepID=A0AAW9Q1K2_9CYAN|nr:MarR family transcriptional regulator [Tumidithrix elongata RA019]